MLGHSRRTRAAPDRGRTTGFARHQALAAAPAGELGRSACGSENPGTSSGHTRSRGFDDAPCCCHPLTHPILSLFVALCVAYLGSFRQAKHAAGSLGVKLRIPEGLAFWTLTVWQDESAMNSFRITLPHRDAMPKLFEWCDEAAAVHRNQESAELPDWETAERRMAESGRLSNVNHPPADQRAGRLDFIRKKAAPNGGGLARIIQTSPNEGPPIDV